MEADISYRSLAVQEVGRNSAGRGGVEVEAGVRSSSRQTLPFPWRALGVSMLMAEVGLAGVWAQDTEVAGRCA